MSQNTWNPIRQLILATQIRAGSVSYQPGSQLKKCAKVWHDNLAGR